MSSAFEDGLKFVAGLRLDLSPSDKKMVKKEIFYEVAKRGEHVAVLIGTDQRNPWHHCIYAGRNAVGEGEVCHMTGDDKATAHIQKDYFHNFAKGRDEVAIILYKHESRDMRKQQLKCARWLYNTFPRENVYQFMGCNCEHFAVMCETGMYESFGLIVTMLDECLDCYEHTTLPKQGSMLVFNPVLGNNHL
jgi:hypothetical protein